MVDLARVPQRFDAQPADADEHYQAYLVRRLLEELALADTVPDPLERSIHLQACRHYRDLLRAFDRHETVRIAAALRALRDELPGADID